MAESQSECVQVAVRFDLYGLALITRVRPLSARENTEGNKVGCHKSPNEPQIVFGNKCFTYDYAFYIDSSQEEVYQKCVSPLTEGCDHCAR